MSEENTDFSIEEANELYSMEAGPALDLDNLVRALKENNRHIKNLIGINDFAKIELFTEQEPLSVSTEFNTVTLPLKACAWDFREIQILIYIIVSGSDYLYTLKIPSVMDVKKYDAYTRFSDDLKMINIKFSEDGMELICEYKKLISAVTSLRILSVKGVV